MASVNKVILIGNLTRDPELRYTPKGTAVAELGIACNRRYRVEDEYREETTFVDVTFWGNRAETASKYLHKGRQIYIEGRLQLDNWEDKNTGQKRSKLRVVGEIFEFLGSRADSGSGGGGGGDDPPPETAPGPTRDISSPPPPAAESSPPPAAESSSAGSSAPAVDFESDQEEDDIPF